MEKKNGSMGREENWGDRGLFSHAGKDESLGSGCC